jgi:tRNA threonylcarbamoyladenosine biosynthesis protein TsaE
MLLRRSEFTYSFEETLAWGSRLGRELPPGAVLALTGELGAGKTALVKGVAQGALGLDPREVSSPTFVYLNIYSSVHRSIYHFDLYRFGSLDDFLAMGFDDYFSLGGISCIEWPEKLFPVLPERALFITLSHSGEQRRRIDIYEKKPLL